MGVRMLQSHICVSPRLPPSPPPRPSLMPKEEIVPGKHGVSVEPDPEGTWGSTPGGGTSSTGWGGAQVRVGGMHGPQRGATAAGRMLTVPASRSHGASGSAGSQQYWGFSVPRSTARRRGYA